MPTTYNTSFYDEIAESFHKTRHALWPGVVKFLTSIPKGSHILDVGCGNGKYLDVRAHDCVIHACDKSINLVHVARKNHAHAHIIEADGLRLPFKDGSYDAVISVAVVHHLSPQDRVKFMNELKRVLKPGGMLLVTVWAVSAVQQQWIPLENKHDYLVPWQSKLNRYYHVFSEEEARDLAADAMDSKHVQVNFERDNWYVVVSQRK